MPNRPDEAEPFVPEPDGIIHRVDSASPYPGPFDPPGPDPRMSKEYISSIMNPNKEPQMHTQPRSYPGAGFEAGQVTEVSSGPTLTNLLDRLEHMYSFIAGLQGTLTGVNDKLGGPIPQETSGGAKSSSDKPGNILAIAHAVASDIDFRLQRIEAEIYRLQRNIGE